MLDYFEEVDLRESILYKHVYRSVPTLRNHLKIYLKEEYDVISIFKFSEHLPDISTVWLNLYIFSLLQQEAKKLQVPTAEKIIPFRIIRLLEKDWFIEVCAALSGVGGIAAVLQLIYMIMKEGKIKTTHNVTHSATSLAGGGFKKSHIYVTNEINYIDNIGSELNISTEKLSEYYREQIEEIQLHTKDGKVHRITKKQLIKIVQD